MEIFIKSFEGLSNRDLYEILQRRAEVFAVEQKISYQDLDGTDLNSIHIFAKENNEIISYLRVIPPGFHKKNASIGRVLTIEKARRRGIGRQLMLTAIEKAKEMSSSIEIDAQAYLIEFYRSLGFDTVSEPFILEGILHVAMTYQNRFDNKGS